MRRRRRGTLTRISAWIRGHWREILRVVRWALLLGLAILAVNEPRGWWSIRTKVEYFGTAILFVINSVMLIRAWRGRTTSTTSTAPTTATGAGSGMTNGIIDICFPFTRVSMPKRFYQIRLDNMGMAYWIIPTYFVKIRKPSDLTICADPDISWEWTQWFGTARIVIKREKKLVPLVFWVREEHAMSVISILVGQITLACAANNKKRFVPPS